MEQVGFGTWNWIAVVIYLLVMLLVGAYFTKRASQSTDSFFTASGRLPSWAVGFSIYATTLSAITFMSTPEKAFLTDWSYIAGNIAIVAIIPLFIYFYVVASLVGILCILYTFLGGFEGVVWSDFIQGVILLGGAAAIIILGVVHIQGGMGTVISDALEHNKIISADNWKFNTAAAAI